MRDAVLVHDILDRARASDAVALITDAGSVSYRRMGELAHRSAAALVRAGLQPGDRCALLLPKGMAECWSIFAVSMAGGVFVPINPLLKSAQVAHICNDCEPSVLLATRALFEPVREALAALTHPPAVLLLDELGTGDADALLADPADATGQPLTTGIAASAAPVTLRANGNRLAVDLAAILYTSGSTGRPKGVMLTHDNLLAGARIVRTYLKLTGADRLAGLLPLSFDYGLNQLLTAVEQQAALVPMSFTFGDQIVASLARHAITGLAGVPTIWAILTRAAPRLRQTPLPALRYITNSGGPVPTATVRELRERLPDTQIFLMYGLTEAFRSTFLDPADIDRHPGSIGKAIPECEVFVLTTDNRRAAPGEHGILVHRGPTVSRGYWRRPEDTARVLRANPLRDPHEGTDTVCVSGDLAFADDDGFLFFVGRNDAMIKSTGYRISPAEVEEALMATGFFAQVAVIGLPDAVAGECVHAVAMAADAGAGTEHDGNTLAREALQACAISLPAYMVPRKIEWVAELPLSPNGKVDYKALRAARVNA